MEDLGLLQLQVGAWAESNFPCADEPRSWLRCTLGVCEEAGELAHAILKREQGIRGTPDEHDEAAQDAIGDICIYLMDLCYRKGWNFDVILKKTVEQVLKRDWVANPKEG